MSEWKEEFKAYVESLNLPRDDYKGIIEYIEDAPTVPVRYARLVKSEIANGYVVCSKCGVAYPLSMKQSVFLNYCSRCGVKFI